jgi:serine/threonine-protein kinase
MMQTLLNNRYRIIRALGAGGFGETHLAEDIEMPSGRRCVIKQLKPMTNDPQLYQLVKERFQREAAILEELGSASNQIPKLYAYFESNGQFYLVQEWIEGVTLATKAQQDGNLSESSVKEILIGLLPVLDYVHGKRIVHRDIKPENIILRALDGKPVLIDFGAVRETMGTIVTSQGNTAQSIVIGTPGFMPSEQLAGKPVYASDIYSLGLTGIYLLTGKIPQEIETDPRTGEILWRRYALSVSPTFSAILDKAIQSHPRDRYSTAQEMLDALQMKTSGISPTIPSPQPTGASIQPPTELSSQSITPNSQPLSSGGGQKAILRESLIIGGLIGASIVISSVFNKPSQQPAEQKVAEKTTSSKPSETSSPVAVPSVQVTSTAQQTAVSPKPVVASSAIPATITPAPVPQVTVSQPQVSDSSRVNQNNANRLDSFYFVADSAFRDSSSAANQIKVLNVAGYRQAGLFWIPDYPNLSGKLLFEVYPAKFSDRQSCANFLRNYSQRNSGAYCGFASKDRNASAERFYANQIRFYSQDK